ncbi:MAG: hypothetical protein ACLRL4_11045 [Bifidobacterium bifidum]
MKQAQVDAGLRDRLREFTQDTTRLSSPGDGETFIPGAGRIVLAAGGAGRAGGLSGLCHQASPSASASV